MPVFNDLPSKDEMSAGTTFTRVALPGNEDYRAKILSIDEQMKTSFEGQPMLVYTAKLHVLSFADGAPLEDVNGNPVEDDRYVWRDLNPHARGFTQSGIASFYRQFICAASGISDYSQKLPGGNTDDFIDREIVVSLQVYTGNDGQMRNKVTGFKPINRRRGQSVPSSHERPEPAVSDEYAKAVAALVEGVDEPSEQMVADTKRRLS